MKIRLVILVAALATGLAVGCQSPAPGGESSDSESDSGSTDGWQAPDIDDPNPLIVVGIDGVKASYLDTYADELDTLTRLADQGVRADSLKPVFPSDSLPNLYSTVTGLYPESHGLVANSVRDPETGETISLGDEEAHTQSRWFGGEPIWVTAERQGLDAGTFFWVGSEATFDGVEPTHKMAYDSSIGHSERTDGVIDWMTDDNPVDFATLYFASTDYAGHQYGPASSEVADALDGVDDQLERLIEGLAEAGLWPDVNLIVVSDHGMTDLDDDKVVFLDDIIDLRDVEVLTWSPVAMIDPDDGHTDEVYNQLAEADDHYTVYRRDELPERYRIADHQRVPEIVVVADKPYSLTSHSYHDDQGLMAGGHGFDPAHDEMHGIFVAHGPDIPADRRTSTLEIVDIYALMSHLLDVEPADHDGSLERIGTEIFGD